MLIRVCAAGMTLLAGSVLNEGTLKAPGEMLLESFLFVLLSEANDTAPKWSGPY